MHDTTKPQCIILVGLPGSGKSTWCATNRESIICSTDDIIEDIAYEYATTYDRIFESAIKLATDIFWKRLKFHGAHKKNLIIDRTNLSVGSRKKLMTALPGYEFHAIIFPTPEKKEWSRRLASREGKTIPEDILASMLKTYEQPRLSEGFSTVSLV